VEITSGGFAEGSASRCTPLPDFFWLPDLEFATANEPSAKATNDEPMNALRGIFMTGGSSRNAPMQASAGNLPEFHPSFSASIQGKDSATGTGPEFRACSEL
jgi:hypothetical protein